MVSARQTKLATINNPGADERERGEVRYIGGSLQWKDVSHDAWVPAVYHNDIRRQLLDRASHNGQSAYTNPRRKGHGSDDETAFHEEQQDWDGARQRWALIRDDVLNILEKDGYVGRDEHQIPSNWYENGRVVLGMFSDPSDPAIPIFCFNFNVYPLQIMITTR